MQKKLKNVFESPLTSGIFATLQALNVPWKNDYVSQDLDIAFASSYGQRNISPLVSLLLDDSGKLSTDNQNRLGSLLVSLYNKNWEKEYAVLSASYDPIQNYSMIETHTGTDTHTDTPTEWKETQTQTPTNWKQTETQTPTNWKETETQTPTNWKKTETQTPTDWIKTDTQTPTDWKETTVGLKADNEAEAENKIYAFNSATAVPVSESNSSASSKSETSRTGTFETTSEQAGTFETETEQSGTFQTETSHSGTFQTETSHSGTFQTETSHSGTFQTETSHTGTYEKEIEYDTELRRSGNIGVTTSQQMIQSEIDLWKWNFFQDVVFKDLAKSLTLSVY